MLDTRELIAAFTRRFGAGNPECFFAPGRVNLIGDHIDYNGGSVLPAAISLGITAIVKGRKDKLLRIWSEDFQEESLIDLEHDLPYQQKGAVCWRDYILATLQVLLDRGVALTGADMLLASDLPAGAGLSSSAAIECLIGYIFHESCYKEQRQQLALDAQHSERHYIGMNCGIMDQFAVSFGKAGHAILLDCATLQYEYIPADFGEYALVIINSNKTRSLAVSQYNVRRAQCEKAFSILHTMDPAEDLCHVHEISLPMLEDDVLYRRAKHAVLEHQRVLQAAEALKEGNIEAFGQLLTSSHVSLDADYEVSCTELNTLVHYCTHFDGCAGARMTGAGFGGCCVALVLKEKVERFITFVSQKYTQKTGLKADFYSCSMAGGVGRLDA